MNAYNDVAALLGHDDGKRQSVAQSVLPEAVPRASLNWRGLVEAAIMLAILSMVDVMIGGHRMMMLQPHPFGAVVLLIAAQYGMAEAAAAAFMAVILLFGLNPVAQQFDQERIVWLSTIAVDPLLWFSAALVLGAVTNRLRRRNVELAETATASRDNLAEMVATNSRLAKALGLLETRIAGQLNTVSAIYEAARELGTELSTVLHGAPALIQAATQCRKCSVYLLEESRLRLAISNGWQQGDSYPMIVADNALYDSITNERTTLLANRASDRRVLGDAGLMATSLVDPADGTVLGMVKIEAIAYDDLNLDTVATFQAVAAWLAQALRQARQMEEAQADRFMTDTRIVSARHSAVIVAQLTRVAARIGFNLSLLQIELPALEDAARPRALMLDAMREVFRASDILLESENDYRHFGVLLPGIPPKGVQDAGHRLLTAIGMRDKALASVMSLSCALLHQVGADADAA